MRIIRGNLIELAKQGNFDVIVHGCNCFHTMGAGIAAQIKREFPGAYKADLLTPYGKKEKLGSVSWAKMPYPYGMWVANAYTQFTFGGEVNVDYLAIRKALIEIRDETEAISDCRIGLPRIGCGLAGGNWEKVEDIILDTLGDLDTTVVSYG